MKSRQGYNIIWYILFTSVSCWICVSALYFPVPEVQLLIPAKLPPDTVLLRVQALLDNGTALDPGTVSYSLEESSLVTLGSSTGELRLGDNTSRHQEGGRNSQATVMAAGPQGETAKMMVNITMLPADGKTLDCDAMVKELCFWPGVKYQVYENRPASLLGPLGPSYMSTVCPQHNLSYSLNAADRYFGLERTSRQWLLRSRQALDREGGEPSQLKPIVMCTATRTGFQQTLNMTLTVMVLDEDDNPPVLVSASVTDKYLNNSQIKQGDILEKDSLMFTDRDNSGVNRFYISLLGDDQQLFRHVCKEEEVTLQERNETAIHCSLTATKTTDLPKDIYTVVLRLNDSSLTAANSPSYVDATLHFHKGTKPMEAMLYPEQASILRGAMLFSRLTQPGQMFDGQAPRFWLTNSSWIPAGGVAPFNVTSEGGIVYISDSLALQSAPDIVQLTIAWDSPGSTLLSVKVTNGSSETCSGGRDTASAPAMCSSQNSWQACTMLCGLGTGGNTTTRNGIKDKMEFMTKGGCAWRGNKTTSSDEMSKDYATCSPDIATCPDGMCDPLEEMNPALCPQDCVPMDKMTGTGLMGSNSSQGIVAAAGVCTCEPTGMCKCEKLSISVPHASTEMATVVSPSMAPFNQEELPNKAEVGGRCGWVCQLVLIIGSLLLIAFILAFLLWRYKRGQGAIVCPAPPCSCSRDCFTNCTNCTNCNNGARCPSCPYCSSCPTCITCSPCACNRGCLLSCLPKRFQRSEPPPPMATTPSSRVSTEFVQSVDAHLLPYNYMAPLGNLNPLHK